MTQTQKHLLYVTESVYPDYTGTVPVYTYQLARQSVRAGYRVTVIAANRTGAPEKEEIEGFTVRRFPVETDGKINYYLSCIKGADVLTKRMIEEDPFDLVQFFHHIPALGARLGGKLKRFNNKMFSHFGSLSNEYSVRSIGKDRGAGFRAETGLHIEGSIFPLLMDNIEAKNFAKCKYITALTGHARLRILEEKVRKDKVFLIPPAVDLERYRPPKSGEREALFGDAGPVFTFIGEFSAINSPDLFVETASQLRKIHPKALFVLAGGGDQEELLRQQIGSHMLEGQTRILPLNDDTPALLRNSDWLLWPSLDDRLPMVFFDAFACGVPVAAFNVGGHAEHLNDGKDCVLAPAANVVELVRRIAEFDAARSGDLSARLRARAEPLTWAAAFDRIHDLYRGLLE